MYSALTPIEMLSGGIMILCILKPQGSHTDILMTGASDRRSYFILNLRIPTSEFVKKNPTPTINCTYVIVNLS